MTGDCHERFCESRGVRFPPATHQTPRRRHVAGQSSSVPPPLHPDILILANLVERWFRELTDKALRRGVFHSVPDLIASIQEYLDAHNNDPTTLRMDSDRRIHPRQGRPRTHRPRKSQLNPGHTTS